MAHDKQEAADHSAAFDERWARFKQMQERLREVTQMAGDGPMPGLTCVSVVDALEALGQAWSKREELRQGLVNRLATLATMSAESQRRLEALGIEVSNMRREVEHEDFIPHEAKTMAQAVTEWPYRHPTTPFAELMARKVAPREAFVIGVDMGATFPEHECVESTPWLIKQWAEERAQWAAYLELVLEADPLVAYSYSRLIEAVRGEQ